MINTDKQVSQSSLASGMGCSWVIYVVQDRSLKMNVNRNQKGRPARTKTDPDFGLDAELLPHVEGLSGGARKALAAKFARWAAQLRHSTRPYAGLIPPASKVQLN